MKMLQPLNRVCGRLLPASVCRFYPISAAGWLS